MRNSGDDVDVDVYSGNVQTNIGSYVAEVKSLKAKYGIDVQSVSSGLYWSSGAFASENPEKREEALISLAKRVSAQVLKTGRNRSLEPMNPYERRIIHAELQSFKGVNTNSIGSESNRKVVIYLDETQKIDLSHIEGCIHYLTLIIYSREIF